MDRGVGRRRAEGVWMVEVGVSLTLTWSEVRKLCVWEGRNGDGRGDVRSLFVFFQNGHSWGRGFDRCGCCLSFSVVLRIELGRGVKGFDRDLPLLWERTFIEELGCRCLVSFCENTGCAEQLFRLGVIELVVAALSSLSASIRVVSASLLALVALVSADTNKTIQTDGLHSKVANAMMQYQSSESLQDCVSLLLLLLSCRCVCVVVSLSRFLCRCASNRFV